MKCDRGSSSSSRDYNKSGKKITEFSYLLQRKCLRMMRRYYKERFEKCGIFTNYKKQIRQLSYEQMSEAIRMFIDIEFNYLSPFAEYINYVHLEESLRTLILCDRYNKNEPIIEGLEFEIVRNVLNKFNTRNLLNFFGDKSNALLFVHYYEAQSEPDTQRQTDVEPAKLMEEMRALYDEADKYVKLS